MKFGSPFRVYITVKLKRTFLNIKRWCNNFWQLILIWFDCAFGTDRISLASARRMEPGGIITVINLNFQFLVLLNKLLGFYGILMGASSSINVLINPLPYMPNSLRRFQIETNKRRNYSSSFLFGLKWSTVTLLLVHNLRNKCPLKIYTRNSSPDDPLIINPL